MELNLKANTPSEQKILEYLQNNASETLAEKINNGTPWFWLLNNRRFILETKNRKRSNLNEKLCNLRSLFK